jgi:23S rRNA (uracil1939-C5)-methyltransferase
MEYEVSIDSITHEAYGVGHLDNGKAIFIEGAIPEETVLVNILKQKNNYNTGKLLSVITPSRNRVEPKCEYFGTCGGCSWQHIDNDAQILYKQQILLDNLKHIGNVNAKNVLKPLIARSWGYRHRARLSVRYVDKKGGVLIGFREKGGRFVMDMDHCFILPEEISNLIPQLRVMLAKLSIKDKIPQLEIAIGERLNVFVIRNMERLSNVDEGIIQEFVDQNNKNNLRPMQIWLQPKGPESCYPFYPTQLPDKLSYVIKNFALEIPYYPSEFTQVNPYINELMIAKAIELLDLSINDTVFDFFCGIGNFTLPIAKIVSKVVGIEGSDLLVKRAVENAIFNDLANNVEYKIANLFTIDNVWLEGLGFANKWLIDPPRDGAINLLESMTSVIMPEIIVYVSCNMATLARDSNILVNKLGYELIDVGVMDMFANTSHVESIAKFKKRIYKNEY